MKKFYKYALLFAAACTIVGCSTDDEDDPGFGELEELGATLPQTGWQESADGSLCTYRGESENPDMPFIDYLAYSFKDGVCTGGTYNMMFDSEAEARAFYNAMMEDMYDTDEYSTRVTFYFEYHLSGTRIWTPHLKKPENGTPADLEMASRIWFLHEDEEWDNGEFGPGTWTYKILSDERNAPWYMHWDGSKGNFSIRYKFGSQSLLLGLTYSMEIDGSIGKASIAQDFGNAAYAQEAYEEMLDDYNDHRKEDGFLAPFPTLNGKVVTLTYTFSLNVEREGAWMLRFQTADEFKTWIRAFLFLHAYNVTNPRNIF